MGNLCEETKIILVDNNEQMRNNIKSQLDGEDYKVVADFFDAVTALEFLKQNEVDVVITDIVLPNIDGYEFMEEINKSDMPNKPKILVLSALSNDNFVNKALNYGADYYMVKPCDINVLKQRIQEIVDGGNTDKSITNIKSIRPRNRQLEEKITNIFITVGIPAHIKGYQFLREAIKMAIDNPEIINSITKKLYPSIAERFETTASKVERAIRHAIEVAWNRGKIENINALFGIRVYSNNEKPTNGEFIALVADKMLIEGA
ncbi:MAG: sporulation transcription factor Spo0A [Clostridia bacterium]|nr:sporulation transcription factor Spo0A [Clostridia bacterium]